MIKRNVQDLKKHMGKFICVYGRSGVGKTVTTLQTSIEPVFWLTFEPRDLERSIVATGKEVNCSVAVYESFMDLMQYLSDLDNFEEYKTVFVDGLSYFMNIAVTSEIKQENMDARAKKPILDFTKVGFDDRGEVNQATFRVLFQLSRLSAAGKIVIVSCLESEKSKYKQGAWNLVAGPELGGKEVPSNFPSFFDLIGRAYDHLHPATPDAEFKCPYCKSKQPDKQYPPIISFESDGNFLAKYTGAGTKRTGLLNWEKILQVVNQ